MSFRLSETSSQCRQPYCSGGRSYKFTSSFAACYAVVLIAMLMMGSIQAYAVSSTTRTQIDWFPDIVNNGTVPDLSAIDIFGINPRPGGSVKGSPGDATSLEPEPVESCYWATWMEKCSTAHKAWSSMGRTIDSFKDTWSSYGNDGYHLQTAEYGNGTWIGFGKKQSGSYRLRTRSSLSVLIDDMRDLWADNYSATALACGDGQYLGWFRKQSGRERNLDEFAGRRGNDDIWERILQLHAEGYYLMSSATSPDDRNYWITWFQKDVDGDHAAYRKSSRENLHQTLEDISNDGDYVTSMAHAGDDWIIYTKSQPGTQSTWATRSNTQDMYDFIADKAKNDDFCATAIGYACSSSS